MRKSINLETWARRDHFNFFKQFEEPFFGLTVNIDCTHAYADAKEQGASFFLYYLHKALAAANAVEAFRYRIGGHELFLYDIVNASPTINRPDGTFGFAYMDYHTDFNDFAAIAQEEITRVQNSKGLVPAVSGENVIHFSSIPWVNFTSLSHARSFSFNDCIPKISFGKMTEANGLKTMPVSIHVHHALMDAYHVGLFVEQFQLLMNEVSVVKPV